MTLSRMVYDATSLIYLRGKLSQREFAKAVTHCLWEQAIAQAKRKQSPAQDAIRERALGELVNALLGVNNAQH